MQDKHRSTKFIVAEPQLIFHKNFSVFLQMLKKIIGKIWKKLTPSTRAGLVRLTQQRFTISVTAVISNEKGEVLLLDHVLRPFSNWGIPGGFIDAGEQPEAGIKREVREETGLELENIRLAFVRTNNRHVEIFFRAEARGKAEAKSREINQAAWFKIDEMPEEMGQRQKDEVVKMMKAG